MSVVMIASAASNQASSVNLAMALGSAAVNFAIGKGSKITPVEKGKTCSGWIFKAAAKAQQVSKASRIPCSPVPALALPVFTTSARIPLLVLATQSKWARHSCTGAAQNRFSVNTPATCVPGLRVMTKTSLRLAFFIPASVIPNCTPATGLSAERSGKGKLTGMINSRHRSRLCIFCHYRMGRDHCGRL